MINPPDVRAEKERRNRLMDSVAATIADGIRREFGRLARVVMEQYRRDGAIGASVLAEHRERVRAVLESGTERMIRQYLADAAETVPKPKGWQEYARKATDELQRGQEEDDDGSEEAALLALLLALGDRLTERWRIERVAGAVDAITTTTWADLLAAVEDAQRTEREIVAGQVRDVPRGTDETIETGRARDEAAEVLRDRVREQGDGRADTIGQTEAGAAESRAADDAVRAVVGSLGLASVRKVWVSRRDDRVRRLPRDEFSHAAADGQAVPINEPFQVPRRGGGTEALEYPRDTRGSAGNVIGCRCVAVYQVGA